MIAKSLTCAMRVPATTEVACGYMPESAAAASVGMAPVITPPTRVTRLLIQNSTPIPTAVHLKPDQFM